MKKLIMIIIFVFPILVNAQVADSLKTKSRFDLLEGIRVVAQKTQEAIGTIKVKKFDENEAVAEVSVAETIDNVAGVDISDGGKQGTELNIRGFENKSIKFMLDGRPLGGGYFDNVDLNTIPVSEIKEIKIIKGPVSALYGSDTMGGVVNIITRSASNSSWLKVGSLMKRNNTNKYFISSSHDFGEWDYWIYSSRYHTDGFMLSDDFEPTSVENGKVRDNALRNQYDFQSKINFSLFDFHSIGFQAGYTFMDEKEIPSHVYENTLRKFIDWQRIQLSAVGFFQITDFVSSDVNVYYDTFDDTYAEYNPSNGYMYLKWPSELQSSIFGVNNKYEWEVSENSNFQFGYRFERQDYTRKDNSSYLEWTSNNQSTQNGFLQSEYIWDKFTFAAGTGISFFKQNGRENWISHIEPSAGIYYQNRVNVSLAVSSNTKYPSLHQLFSSSSGNPDLEEERAKKSELTIDIPFSDGSISQSIFYNQVDNLISKSGQYENQNRVDSYGFEFEGNYDFITTHMISYTFIDYTDDSDIGILNVPKNSVVISEKYQLPYEINMIYEAKWKDIRNYNEDDVSVILPAYWLHSISWYKSWNRYMLKLGLDNIFDTDYQEKYGYPCEGFNFVFSVEAELF